MSAIKIIPLPLGPFQVNTYIVTCRETGLAAIIDPAGEPQTIMDTLFVGNAGRTDLKGGSLDRLIRSVETKLLVLADDTCIWPGHDYGEQPTSTMGREKKENPYITDFILDPGSNNGS